MLNEQKNQLLLESKAEHDDWEKEKKCPRSLRAFFISTSFLCGEIALYKSLSEECLCFDSTSKLQKREFVVGLGTKEDWESIIRDKKIEAVEKLTEYVREFEIRHL